MPILDYNILFVFHVDNNNSVHDDIQVVQRTLKCYGLYSTFK